MRFAHLLSRTDGRIICVVLLVWLQLEVGVNGHCRELLRRVGENLIRGIRGGFTGHEFPGAAGGRNQRDFGSCRRPRQAVSHQLSAFSKKNLYHSSYLLWHHATCQGPIEILARDLISTSFIRSQTV